MAKMSLEELTNALRVNEFENRSDEALQEEAEARYTQTYDAMRSAAQQRQATIDAAYARELESLASTLSSSQQSLNDAAARNNASIDDYINTRSMQRTSYGAASKGSTIDAMNKAAAQLAQQYATASSGLENSRVLLAEQLSQTLAQYDRDYLADVQAYIDEQKQLDYDRKVEADAAYNELQMALYEYGKSGSGGSSRRSSGSGTLTTDTGTGNLFANLASREVQTQYSLNPSFGTTNQTTKGTTYAKSHDATKNLNTYVSPSGKTYQKS